MGFILPVVGHNQDTSSKVVDGLLQTPEGVYIEVVCGLVEQQQVARLLEGLGQMEAIPLPCVGFYI